MSNKAIYILFITFIIMMFTSCGGGSDNKWGIDNKSGILLPICNGDKNTTTNAVELIPGYTIEPLLENTNLLLWHYSNSQKTACVSTGKAIMKDL
jgi:hypothetical protein